VSQPGGRTSSDDGDRIFVTLWRYQILNRQSINGKPAADFWKEVDVVGHVSNVP